MSQQNNIEILSAVFAAGESKIFALSGEYFEVIDCTGPIDVVLSDISGAQLARLSQAQASFYSKSVSFGVIQITSASAQTVRFAYGSGETGTRRSSGSMSISGPVALDAATLAALEVISISSPISLGASTLSALASVDLKTATIDSLKNPYQSTSSYSQVGALAANTPVTIFSPGANANGAILISAGFSDIQTVPFVANMVAKTSAPANPTDGEIVVLGLIAYSANSNPTVLVGKTDVPAYLPAGVGLYYIQSVANPGNYARSARYRLL